MKKMKTEKLKSNSGLTITEVIVVLGILSVFSIFLVNIVITSQNAWLVQNTSVPMRVEAKQTMEAMAKELREGDPSAPGGIVIGGAGNSQITFQVPNQVSQAGVQSWRQIQFSHNVALQQVVRTEGVNVTTLGRNITSLQFAEANNVITTTVGARRITSGGLDVRSTLTSQVRLRN